MGNPSDRSISGNGARGGRAFYGFVTYDPSLSPARYR
jgi:hypothetical protein